MAADGELRGDRVITDGWVMRTTVRIALCLVGRASESTAKATHVSPYAHQVKYEFARRG
jgi:hypothetical protein